MLNPGLYIGVTVLQDSEEGGKEVASFTGQAYPQGMNDLSIAMVESLMVNEFGDEFMSLIKKLDERLSEVGIAIGEAKAGGAATADAAKGAMKKAPNVR